MTKTKSQDELSNTFIDWRVSELLPKLEALAPFDSKKREKGIKTENLDGWRILAAKEAALLKAYYPDERAENEKEYGTCLRQITALKKHLKKAVPSKLEDKGLAKPVLNTITSFGNALSFLFSQYKHNQNVRVREDVLGRSDDEDRIIIDISKQLIYANQILEKAAKNELLTSDWKEVSCALALVTGRRMAEIHLSASFEKVGEYEVIFKGYLKGKSREVSLGKLGEKVPVREYPFRIPTLIKADLVISGLAWLGKKGKRIDPSEDPERVNRRYSSALSGTAKNWDFMGDEEKFTYHKFRAGYFVAAIENYQGKAMDIGRRVKEILGDDDEVTIDHYRRFNLSPDSLSRI